MTTPPRIDRPSWDETFRDILEVFAKRSRCLKYKTSAMVVSGSQILAFGYNGTFSKCAECDEYWRQYYLKKRVRLPFNEWIDSQEFRDIHREWSKVNEIHAEVNALNWISKRDISDSYVLYTYYSPCDACSKEIISYGIKNVRYIYEYPSGQEALTRLKEAGVLCIKI